jgi:malic enzyme
LIMLYEKEALHYHSEPRPEKIEVKPIRPDLSQSDLPFAYANGVASSCVLIANLFFAQQRTELDSFATMEWDMDFAEKEWDAGKATMAVIGKNKAENIHRGAPAPLWKKILLLIKTYLNP